MDTQILPYYILPWDSIILWNHISFSDNLFHSALISARNHVNFLAKYVDLQTATKNQKLASNENLDLELSLAITLLICIFLFREFNK